MSMMKVTVRFLLDLLFPRRCISCGKVDKWLCEACFSYIRPTIEQVCYICRKSSEKAKTCQHHSSDDPLRRLDRLIVTAHYSANPIIKKAIHALKYNNKPEDIVEQLGELLAQTLSLHHSLFHYPRCVFIPVPLHELRQKKRGYNQAELLVRQLERHFPKLLTARPHFLTRSKETPSQVSSANRKARLENLKEAFHLNGTLDPAKTYILIDDVVTTGATLEECCKVLKKHGVREVWGLVLARN